jgi:hypothetical protein
MSYLEMALRVGRKLDALNAGHSTESRPTPVSARVRVTRMEESEHGELAPCGSPHCAGCYDVGNGRKIHPPRCGEEWLLRLETKGRIQ